jgi:hypothetical protein
MITKIKEILEKIFIFIKDKKRLVLIALILLVLGFAFSQYVKTLIFVAIFIALGGISKFYHRFFKSTVGIDLILYTTLMAAIVYRNMFFSFAVGWVGLIIADSLGMKFSYTSIISLSGLTVVILMSRFFIGLPIIFSLILLTVIFEIVSILMYYFMGSSPQKILIFLISHLLFNLFMIFTFTETLVMYMI